MMKGVLVATSLTSAIQIVATISSQCSQYLLAAKNAKADIERLRGELGRLKIVFEGAQKLLQGPDGSRLETSALLRNTLDECSSQLMHIELKLEKKLHLGKRSKIIKLIGVSARWPFESTEVDSVIQTLQRYHDTLSTALNIDHVAETLEIGRNIRSLGLATQCLMDGFEQIEDKERLEILEWISPIAYGKNHNVVKEVRVQDTCEWLLQHEKFRDWEASGSSILIWLQGSPGTGKTFLTSRVIDHLQSSSKTSPNQGLGFFYCSRNEPERREPLSVLRSYLRQLSSSTESPRTIQKRLREVRNEITLKGSALTVDACKTELLNSMNLYANTTLILDALDECESDARGQLIEAIEFLLLNSEKPLKIFISSRPDRYVRNRFLDKSNIEITAWNNEEDIRRLVDAKIIEHGNWANMHAPLKKEIFEVLTERSGGMFQWVHLQIKQLLNLESEEAIKDRLGKLPKGLEASYDEIYDEIRARNKYDRALADRAFMFIMCAYKPLKSNELLSALRQNPEDGTCLAGNISESQLLHLCNNLLVHDSQQQVWRFSHLSVAEYFEENHWSVQNCHCYASKLCLRVLIESYKEVYVGASQGLSSTASDALDPDHPLVVYSQQFWTKHVQTQEGNEPDVMLSQLLKNFLGSPGESSVQYRKWYGQISSNGSSPLKFDSSYSKKINLSPESISAFAMCYFSFYSLLSDWWDNAEIPLLERNNQGDDLLTLAAVAGCRPICHAILNRVTDFALKSHNYGQALADAAHKGQFETAKFLVKHGADVNLPIQGKDYRSALAAAARQGNMEIVKYLVENGADINMPLHRNTYGSALAAAAFGGHVEILAWLIENGAEVNKPLESGHYGSALCAAAYGGYLEVVQCLVDKGADINMPIKQWEHGGVLGAALLWRNFDVFFFLIEQGAQTKEPPYFPTA